MTETETSNVATTAPAACPAAAEAAIEPPADKTSTKTETNQEERSCIAALGSYLGLTAPTATTETKKQDAQQKVQTADPKTPGPCSEGSFPAVPSTTNGLAASVVGMCKSTLSKLYTAEIGGASISSTVECYNEVHEAAVAAELAVWVHYSQDYVYGRTMSKKGFVGILKKAVPGSAYADEFEKRIDEDLLLNSVVFAIYEHVRDARIADYDRMVQSKTWKQEQDGEDPTKQHNESFDSVGSTTASGASSSDEGGAIFPAGDPQSGSNAASGKVSDVDMQAEKKSQCQKMRMEYLTLMHRAQDLQLEKETLRLQRVLQEKLAARKQMYVKSGAWGAFWLLWEMHTMRLELKRQVLWRDMIVRPLAEQRSELQLQASTGFVGVPEGFGRGSEATP